VAKLEAALRSTTKTTATEEGMVFDGVPANVMAGIRSKAAELYPTDYDMQVFVIDEKVAAWKKLHPAKQSKNHLAR
jgi:hypothetical protein